MEILCVLLLIPAAFAVSDIITDYLFPRIPLIERILENLPLWKEDRK